MNSASSARTITNLARDLRRNQTDAENLLWAKLRLVRLNGLRFRRQHPVGHYIVDFICLEKRLIVEVDGGQHAEKEEQDSTRTKWLEDEGYRVVRFCNNDVLTNVDGVLFRIMETLKIEVSPSPSLSPLRERD